VQRARAPRARHEGLATLALSDLDQRGRRIPRANLAFEGNAGCLNSACAPSSAREPKAPVTLDQHLCIESQYPPVEESRFLHRGQQETALAARRAGATRGARHPRPVQSHQREQKSSRSHSRVDRLSTRPTKGTDPYPEPSATTQSGAQVLSQTRSQRSGRWPAAPVTAAEAGQLLWLAQGVTDAKALCTAPSAVAAYPLMLYLVAGWPSRHRGDGRAPLPAVAVADCVARQPA